MSPEILTILPNLSIGVAAIGGLVYVPLNFIRHLNEQSTRQELREAERADRHGDAMKEREFALREVEREVRTNILSQLSKNTEIMNDTSKVMERAIMILDKGK